MLKNLFFFPGGVKPEHHKQESVTQPIAAAPLPERLILPLKQSVGAAPRPVVTVGEKVCKGQPIAAAEGWISASLHAPTSGTVVDIGNYPIAHPSGLAVPAIVIEADGRDAWGEHAPLDYEKRSPREIQNYLQAFGVVGLGGATFPSHVKLSTHTPVEELIINGAECEPYITCDDLLMRARAADIIAGVAFLRDVLNAKRVVIAIENNKPEAAAALRAAAAAKGENFTIGCIPTCYPAGSLRQLIYTLTGKRAPTNVLPGELGVQCFNVATAYSVWRAVAHGEPVIRRVVTVSGNVRAPQNWEAPIGMAMDALLQLSEPLADTDGVIVGGPMMGFSAPTLNVPLMKGSNCLIARSPKLFPARPPESPCIRCTSCAQACPQGLQPFELYWWSRARNFAKVEEYALSECIECGCCAYVCPASIPLVQYFRFAKSEIRAAAKEQKMAESARARFEFRQFRAEREKAERAEKLARAAAAQAAKLEAAGGAQHDAESAKQAIIAAAVERASVANAAADSAQTENH
ncbi:MAG: electron transport complex subunit RsxC [Zoogloeaceae bacterium]|nr:electron transport complex subunit RsxC [Zoogloeaceae bacterium]